jgi:hypothetical protein
MSLAEESRELELLLCCARTRLEEAQAQRINALLQEPLDWAYLLKLAERHSLRSLLYWHLRAIPDALPAPVGSVLRAHLLATTQRNILLAGELRDLLKIFAAHGSNAVPFKGPTLTGLLYGNLGLREFNDLDILVFPGEVTTAKELLLARGYQPVQKFSTDEEKFLLTAQCEYGFRREDWQLLVEIHWRLLPRYFSCEFDLELWRQRLSPAPLLGANTPTFAPEDLLLYLCVHGAKHGWGNLGWVCDIAEMLRAQPQLAWDAVQQQAQELGLERMLHLGLWLAHDLLGATFPAALGPPDATTRRLAAQVRQSLTKITATTASDLNLEGLAFAWRARERWRDRLAYGWRILLAPANVQRSGMLAWPMPFALLHYLWRPVWLAFRLAGHLLNSSIRFKKKK